MTAQSITDCSIAVFWSFCSQQATPAGCYAYVTEGVEQNLSNGEVLIIYRWTYNYWITAVNM